MIKVIVIDDEPLARSIVLEYLSKHSDIEVVAECPNGFEGVKAIQQHQPDLIFLDIQMPKITGFEMLELLDHAPSVIFTTAFDEYAIKAFEANAVDYLLKPFSGDRFEKALNKWRNERPNAAEQLEKINDIPHKQEEEAQRIVVKNGSNIHIIPIHEIQTIEAFDDYVKIFTANDYFLKKKPLSYFENIFPSDEFLRVHRSHLIQLKSIVKIEPYEKTNHIAILQNDRRVPLSRSGYQRLREVLKLG